MVECLTRGRGFEPHWRHCVVVLERMRVNSALGQVGLSQVLPCLQDKGNQWLKKCEN